MLTPKEMRERSVARKIADHAAAMKLLRNQVDFLETVFKTYADELANAETVVTGFARLDTSARHIRDTISIVSLVLRGMDESLQLADR